MMITFGTLRRLSHCAAPRGIAAILFDHATQDAMTFETRGIGMMVYATIGPTVRL
jgi:hypothetical protein